MASIDTSALDGFRVLNNIWIMIFHSLFIIMYFLPASEVPSLFKQIPTLEHGYLAVDGFFMLTGFLMALPWLREIEMKKTHHDTTSWWESVLRFWDGRFVRVMIPYAFLTLLHCGVINRCGTHRLDDGTIRLQEALSMFRLFFPTAQYVDNGCGGLWANALHIPFLMPFNGAFMHTWSLGVQYQAWMWLPVAWHGLKLGVDSRLAWFTAAVSAASIAFRACAWWHQSMGFGPSSITGGFLDLFWYSSPFARGHIIVAGMLVAQIGVQRADAVHEWAATAPQPLVWAVDTAVWCAFAAYVHLNVVWKDALGGDPRYTRGWTHALFSSGLQVGTPLSSLIWGMLLLSLCWRVGPGARTLGHMLSGPVWAIPAALSFHAFLLHPMVMTALYSHPAALYPPSAADSRPGSLTDSVLKAMPMLARWIAFRERVAPSGLPLPHGTMMLFHTVTGVLCTYAVSAIGLYCWEWPLNYAIKRLVGGGRCIQCTKWYSVAVMAVGVVASPIVVGAVFVLVKPELEAAIVDHFTKAAASANATMAMSRVQGILQPELE